MDKFIKNNNNDNFNYEEENNQIKHIEQARIERKISGFWRRLFAFLIDTIVLGIAGFFLGKLLGAKAYELGNWALLIGFMIAMLYYGILNSGLGKGQTIGKRILKIQVVNSQGQTIQFKRALIRTFVLVAPQFTSNLLLPPHMQSNLIISGLLYFINIGLGFGLIYFYIFNRKTRQSIHDLLCSTFVVKKEPEGNLNAPEVWRVHYGIYVVVLLIFVIAPYIIKPSLDSKFNFAEIEVLQREIYEIEGLQAVSVTDNYIYQNQKTLNSLNIAVNKSGIPSLANEVIDKTAEVVVNNYQKVEEKDILAISVTYQYNFGIFRWHRTYNKWMPPNRWKEYLNK